MWTGGVPVREGPARFDVSSQYAMQRQAFAPIFVVLGLGLILVEVLVGLSLARSYPHAPTSLVAGSLILPAVCFAATFGFVLTLLRARAIQEIAIDEAGIHVVRIGGRTIDHEWKDAALHLEFRERTPSLGVRSQPPPDDVRVLGRGFPIDLAVPFQAYELAIRQAPRHGVAVATRTEEHHGRFGTFYWWVTTLGNGTGSPRARTR